MIQINRDRCTGCGACLEACPSDAIAIQDGFAIIILGRCTDCGACVAVCPQGAALLLPEPVPAADSHGRAIAESESQPTDPSQEIITVRVPPPPILAPPRPAPARQLGLALGAALTFLGREVAPRLMRLAADWVEDRILTPQKPSSPALQKPSSRAATRQSIPGGGQRRRQRQRGKK